VQVPGFRIGWFGLAAGRLKSVLVPMKKSQIVDKMRPKPLSSRRVRCRQEREPADLRSVIVRINLSAQGYRHRLRCRADAQGRLTVSRPLVKAGRFRVRGRGTILGAVHTDAAAHSTTRRPDSRISSTGTCAVTASKVIITNPRRTNSHSREPRRSEGRWVRTVAFKPFWGPGFQLFGRAGV
jgi:hypothetical protein